MSTRRRLAEVFRALAPMTPDEAQRRADLAIETLAASYPRSELQLLAVALRALELPPLNRASGAGWNAFSSSDDEIRERILLGWAHSRIPRRRTAFQAWKRLGQFLAYADPGPDRDHPGNPAWDRIGYAPPEPPLILRQPSVATMAVDRASTTPLELDADVVIVGSGAGGGLVAARLAEAGVAALVVEAGPYRSESEMPTLEADGFRELFLDRGTTSTTDLAVTILAGQCVGGGTTVNWTTTLPPPDHIRETWARNHGLEGFDGASFEADRARLIKELDLRPPSVIPPKDRVILDGAKALGWEAGPNQRNAGPCYECGGCTFGCQRGSKRSGLRAHLAAASAAGARVLADARVERLLHGSGRAEGVAGRLAEGRPFRVRASRVVLAAGGLRTPTLLERSGIEHPAIGRYLRLHPVVAIAARMAEPVDMWIGPSQAARSLEFARPGPAHPSGIGGAHGGFIIESAPPHPGLAAAAFPWAGRGAAANLMGKASFIAPLLAIMGDTGAGRVRAQPRGHAHITYRLASGDAATGRRALVEMARLGRAAGAVELWSVATPPAHWAADGGAAAFHRLLRDLAATDMGANRVALFSAHQMGTARAGADSAAHACDPHGRVRLDRSGRILRGGYVGDASLFPTAVGVNPMLTVMLMAERTARTVLADREAAT
jgi:choline dehydrogenase-like flavoprotein